MTSEIISLIKTRDKVKKSIQKSIKKNSNEELIINNREIYRKLRNKTRIKIRKSKTNYIYNKIKECDDNRQLWKILTKLVPNKQNSKQYLFPISAKKLNDSFIDESDLLIEKTFNSTNDFIPEFILRTNETFSIPKITEQNVKDISDKLSLKKATGSDGISAKFIKTFLTSLFPH